jgi:hypothetical protein
MLIGERGFGISHWLAFCGSQPCGWLCCNRVLLFAALNPYWFYTSPNFTQKFVFILFGTLFTAMQTTGITKRLRKKESESVLILLTTELVRSKEYIGTQAWPDFTRSPGFRVRVLMLHQHWVLIAGSTKEMVGLKNTLVPRLGQTSPEAQGLGFKVLHQHCLLLLLLLLFPLSTLDLIHLF